MYPCISACSWVPFRIVRRLLRMLQQSHPVYCCAGLTRAPACLAVAADVRAALQRDSGVSTAQARERGRGVRPWVPTAPHDAAAAPQPG